MIKFVLLKNVYCEHCKKVVLHEFGWDSEKNKEVKQCIRCGTLTEVK